MFQIATETRTAAENCTVPYPYPVLRLWAGLRVVPCAVIDLDHGLLF